MAQWSSGVILYIGTLFMIIMTMSMESRGDGKIGEEERKKNLSKL